MSTRADAIFKTVLQIVAIVLLALIVAVILHKGYADVSAISREHSGADFWRALARHLFKNLSGA